MKEFVATICTSTRSLDANEIRRCEDIKVLVDQSDATGRTASCLAAEGGHVEVVKLLREAGANLDTG